MPQYRIDRAKNLSFHARYEVLHTQGIMVEGQLLKGKALDEYVDQLKWRTDHPGEDPVKVIGNGE